MRLDVSLLILNAAVLFCTTEANSLALHYATDMRQALFLQHYGSILRPCSSLHLRKRELPTVGKEGTNLIANSVSALHLAYQHVRYKTEQAREILVPFLRHHLEAVARAEVPRPLRSWTIFQDGGSLRESIRKSNTAFVRALDKVRQPSQEYRYMRKKWRYEPDLRKHYFFPRILRVPVISQESELPYDKEVENFTKGNDDEFGHRSLVLAHLPLYANRFAEKPESVVVPAAQNTEATLQASEGHELGTDKTDFSSQRVGDQQWKQDSDRDATESSNRQAMEQQASMQAATTFWPESLTAIRPKKAEPAAELQGKVGTKQSGTTEAESPQPVTPSVTTPRHTPHGSDIFFHPGDESNLFHREAALNIGKTPLQDMSQSDISSELAKLSQSRSQGHAAKVSDAMEVALNFHNTLMGMRHRYNSFLDYQRSQIHKASLRYIGHPEYVPELDPNPVALDEGIHDSAVDSPAQHTGEHAGTPIYSPRSQFNLPHDYSGGSDAWTPRTSEADRFFSGTASPTRHGQQVFDLDSEGHRYPAQYADYLFAAYREMSADTPRSPVFGMHDGGDFSPSRGAEGALKPAVDQFHHDIKPSDPHTPPPSPERWDSRGEPSQVRKQDPDETSTLREGTDPLPGTFDATEADKSGFRRFSSKLNPVEIPLSKDRLLRTSSLHSPKQSGDETPSLQRQNAEGRLSRISSAASFAFRSPASLADHPTPRMPPSSEPLVKEKAVDSLAAKETPENPRKDTSKPVFEKLHGQEDVDSLTNPPEQSDSQADVRSTSPPLA